MKKIGKAVRTAVACALALMITFGLVACGKSNAPVSVKIIGKPQLNTVCVGDSFTLSFSVSPENSKTDSVAWDSSDKTVATVSAEGKVTALAVGSSEISVSVGGGAKDSFTLTVSAKKDGFESIVITKDRDGVTLSVGQTYEIQFVADPVDAVNKTIKWKSSDETVATVNDGGVITALKAGSALITGEAENGNGRATLNVTVAEFTEYVQDFSGVTESDGKLVGADFFASEGITLSLISEEGKNSVSVKRQNAQGYRYAGLSVGRTLVKGEYYKIEIDFSILSGNPTLIVQLLDGETIVYTENVFMAKKEGGYLFVYKCEKTINDLKILFTDGLNADYEIKLGYISVRQNDLDVASENVGYSESFTDYEIASHDFYGDVNVKTVNGGGDCPHYLTVTENASELPQGVTGKALKIEKADGKNHFTWINVIFGKVTAGANYNFSFSLKKLGGSVQGMHYVLTSTEDFVTALDNKIIEPISFAEGEIRFCHTFDRDYDNMILWIQLSGDDYDADGYSVSIGNLSCKRTEAGVKTPFGTKKDLWHLDVGYYYDDDGTLVLDGKREALNEANFTEICWEFDVDSLGKYEIEYKAKEKGGNYPVLLYRVGTSPFGGEILADAIVESQTFFGEEGVKIPFSVTEMTEKIYFTFYFGDATEDFSLGVLSLDMKLIKKTVKNDVWTDDGDNGSDDIF